VVHLQEAPGLSHGDAGAAIAAGPAKPHAVVERSECAWKPGVLDRHLHGPELPVQSISHHLEAYHRRGTFMEIVPS